MAANRSPLLQALLQKQITPPQRVSSYGQLAAELGAQLLRQQQVKKIEGKNSADLKAIIDAMRGQPGVIDESGAMGGAQPGNPQQALMLALQNPDVMQGNPMLAQLLMQQTQGPEEYTLAPGAVRMRGGDAVAANPGEARDPDIIHKIRAAGFDPATPEGQAFARELLMKPGVEVNMNDKFGPVPGGMRRVPDKASPTGSRLVGEPGAPTGKLPAETSAKLGMLDAAQKSLNEARGVLFKDGSYRRGLLTALHSPVRTGAASTLYNAMRDAMGNRLRAESGGAITPEEVDDQTERFLPKPWDSKDEAEARFRRFEQFISSYRHAVGADPQTAQLGTLSPAEQAELDELEKRFGR